MGHFHKLLCEEMIFPLQKGKNYGLRYKPSFFPNDEIGVGTNDISSPSGKNHFFTLKDVEMP
jgi:hypothetical protein